MIRRDGGGNFTREWGMTWGHLESSEKRIQVGNDLGPFRI
jgi:hypothetical protein